jgi:DNA-binding transcriptional LysR family regulator
MTSLKLIEAFYWVAKLRSFHATARRLNVTQPTVTYRVKELERQIARPLLVRSDQPVRLTPQGQAVFAYAERLVSLMQEMQEHLGRDSPVSGVLRLGVMDAFAAICLPDLLQDLSERHPNLAVSVVVDLSHSLTLKLDAGELDIAVVSTPPSVAGLRYVRLGTLNVAWIATPRYRGIVGDARALARQRIFSTPPPSNVGTIIADWFRDAGIEMPTLSICNSMPAIVGLVTAGAGIGVMPVKLVETAIQAGTLCVLDAIEPVAPQDVFIGVPVGVLDPVIPVTTEAIRAVVGRHAFSS